MNHTKRLLMDFISENTSYVSEIIPDGEYLIAGGCFRSMFLGTDITDIDIYLTGSNAVDRLDNIAHKFKNKNIAIDRYRVSHGDKILTICNIPALKTQFMVIYLDKTTDLSYREIINTFDFIPASFGCLVKRESSGNFEIKETIEHIDYQYSLLRKLLLVNNEGKFIYKQTSIQRICKYIQQYGFSIPKSEMHDISLLLKQNGTSDGY